MDAERIIRSGTEELTERRNELMSLYNSNESALSGEFLLEEAALIETELKNRGYRLQWERARD